MTIQLHLEDKVNLLHVIMHQTLSLLTNTSFIYLYMAKKRGLRSGNVTKRMSCLANKLSCK